MTQQNPPLPIILAESIRQLFEESGATKMEQLATLKIANAMLILSKASFSSPSQKFSQQPPRSYEDNR